MPALYNLILEDTIIEDVPLSEAMDIAELYAEVESNGTNYRKFHRDGKPVFYEYVVMSDEGRKVVATIEDNRKGQ